MKQRQDKRKQSIYITAEVLDEIIKHSERLDRSFSWVVQYGLTNGGFQALNKVPSMSNFQDKDEG